MGTFLKPKAWALIAAILIGIAVLWTVQQRQSTPLPRSAEAAAPQATAPARSMQGTVPDGQIRVMTDSAAAGGGLVVDVELRKFFDYHLSAVGEKTIEAIRAEAEAELDRRRAALQGGRIGIQQNVTGGHQRRRHETLGIGLEKALYAFGIRFGQADFLLHQGADGCLLFRFTCNRGNHNAQLGHTLLQQRADHQCLGGQKNGLLTTVGGMVLHLPGNGFLLKRSSVDTDMRPFLLAGGNDGGTTHDALLWLPQTQAFWRTIW